MSTDHPRLARRAALMRLALTGLACTAAPALAADEAGVSLDFARSEQSRGRALLIDIREPGEHATGVAEGATLMPMSELARRIDEIPRDADRPVLLICRTQNRSSVVARALQERGFRNVRFVEGGMSEWTQRGWPLTQAPQAARP